MTIKTVFVTVFVKLITILKTFFGRLTEKKNDFVRNVKAFFAEVKEGYQKVYQRGMKIGIAHYFGNARMLTRNDYAIFEALGKPSDIIGGIIAVVVLFVSIGLAMNAYYAVNTDGWDSNTVALWDMIPFVVVAGLIVAFATVGYTRYRRRR